MNNVINMGEACNDNTFISPAKALQDALNDLCGETDPCDRILILALNDKDDEYRIRYYAANISGIRMLALIARFNHIMNSYMDGK
ncbi:MAG: hypothetical protein AB7G80_09885 [Dongiaceae bacterium]